jgi:hypothetical protein
VRAGAVHREDATMAFNLACYASDTGRILSPTNGRNNEHGRWKTGQPDRFRAFFPPSPLRKRTKFLGLVRSCPEEHPQARHVPLSAFSDRPNRQTGSSCSGFMANALGVRARTGAA